jgi:hypothetical protein
MVLAKAQICVNQQVPYSVLKQTDCDSLTRWLYTDERWESASCNDSGWPSSCHGGIRGCR